MKRPEIESFFAEDRDSVKVPERMDRAVLEAGRNARPAPLYLRPLRTAASAVLVLAVVLLSGYGLTGKQRSETAERECRKIYAEMIRAVEERDVESSLSFYSFSELGLSEDEVRDNISRLYRDYDRISYKVSDVRVTARGREAVAESEYEFTAVARADGKDLHYRGADRIYFRREDGGYKIYFWIDRKVN